MSSRTEFQSANVLLKDRSKPQFVCDLIYLIVWALSNHTVSFTVINKFCIKNTIALIFRLIDSSSSDLKVLELKKNASLDPELVWLLYSEELGYNQLKLCFFVTPYDTCIFKNTNDHCWHIDPSCINWEEMLDSL